MYYLKRRDGFKEVIEIANFIDLKNFAKTRDHIVVCDDEDPVDCFVHYLEHGTIVKAKGFFAEDHIAYKLFGEEFEDRYNLISSFFNNVFSNIEAVWVNKRRNNVCVVSSNDSDLFLQDWLQENAFFDYALTEQKGALWA